MKSPLAILFVSLVMISCGPKSETTEAVAQPEVASDNTTVSASGVGDNIKLGMTVSQLISQNPDMSFKREVTQGEGDPEIQYNYYNGDQLVISVNPLQGEEDGDTTQVVDRIWVSSGPYSLSNGIRIGSSFDDIRGKSVITSIYGMETGDIAVTIEEIPGVIILVDPQGIDEVFPGKDFTQAQVKGDQKVTGFYIVDLEH